jgi:hypothetical protein
MPPANGWTGGHKYDETYRFHFGKISIRHRTQVIAEIMRIAGCDEEKAESIFAVGSKKKDKRQRFFKHHGNSLWSGTHPTVANPSDAELAKAKADTPGQTVGMSDITECQRRWIELLGELPQLYHSHNKPENCPVLQWMQATPERVAIIGWFQARSESPKVRNLPQAQYAHCLWDNRSDRDELAPTIKLRNGREQGILWYDRALFRNAGEMDRQQFETYAIAAGHPKQTLDNAVKVAIRKGDLLVDLVAACR